MFVREKTVNGYTYLYLVENVRENGRTKQRIIRNLGRKEAVLGSGALDRLIASIGRFAERSLVLRAIEEVDTRFEVRWIGTPLLFGRLWEESGLSMSLEGGPGGQRSRPARAPAASLRSSAETQPVRPASASTALARHSAMTWGGVMR